MNGLIFTESINNIKRCVPKRSGEKRGGKKSRKTTVMIQSPEEPKEDFSGLWNEPKPNAGRLFLMFSRRFGPCILLEPAGLEKRQETSLTPAGMRHFEEEANNAGEDFVLQQSQTCKKTILGQQANRKHRTSCNWSGKTVPLYGHHSKPATDHTPLFPSLLYTRKHNGLMNPPPELTHHSDSRGRVPLGTRGNGSEPAKNPKPVKNTGLPHPPWGVPPLCR